LWIEVDHVDLGNLDQPISHIAHKLRPIPVAGFRVSDRTVVVVNDQHFQEGTRPNTSPDNDNLGSTSERVPDRSGSDFQDHEEILRGNHLPEVQGPRVNSPIASPSNTVGKEPNRPAVPGSSDPSRSSVTSTSIPFVAIFTAEDVEGAEQDVEMTISVDLETQKPGAQQVVTKVSLPFVQVVLPSPRRHLEHPSVVLNPSLLRAMALKVSVGVPVIHERAFLFNQYPQPHDFITKISSTSELNVGATVVASTNPAFHLMLMKKGATTIDRIPLWNILNLKDICIGKDGTSGEHVWDYPVRSDREVKEITLLPHSSSAKYERRTPITKLRIALEVSFEIPGQRHGRRNWKGKKCSGLSVDYRHMKMIFTLEISKRNGSELLQFDAGDIEGSTTRLHHKLPPTGTEENQVKGICGDTQYGLAKVSSCAMG